MQTTAPAHASPQIALSRPSLEGPKAKPVDLRPTLETLSKLDPKVTAQAQALLDSNPGLSDKLNKIIQSHMGQNADFESVDLAKLSQDMQALVNNDLRAHKTIEELSNLLPKETRRQIGQNLALAS